MQQARDIVVVAFAARNPKVTGARVEDDVEFLWRGPDCDFAIVLSLQLELSVR